MAKFTTTIPLNVEYQGHHLIGVAGTTHRLPDSLKVDFANDYGTRIPISWVVPDEIAESGGAHPDLSAHNTLGLATQAELDAHEAAADPHTVYALDTALTDHAAAADPHTGYQRESEKGVANGYASLDASGLVPDAQIPAAIARDSEVTTAVSDHAGAADPHTGYALDSDLTTHAGAADPHTGYRLESADHSHASAGLQGGTVAHSALTGVGADDHHARQHSITAAADHTFPGGSTFLRADGTFASPPGGSEAFPVGSVFIAVVSTSPSALLGYGTWAAFAAGRVLVGIDSGQTEFDVVEETGGAKTHTLTTAEMPAHTHVETNNSATTGGLVGWGARDTSTNTQTATGYSTESTGGGGAHNNLQPYIVVYMWKRTA